MLPDAAGPDFLFENRKLQDVLTKIIKSSLVPCRTAHLVGKFCAALLRAKQRSKASVPRLLPYT
jgi:hypothetical protein